MASTSLTQTVSERPSASSYVLTPTRHRPALAHAIDLIPVVARCQAGFGILGRRRDWRGLAQLLVIFRDLLFEMPLLALPLQLIGAAQHAPQLGADGLVLLKQVAALLKGFAFVGRQSGGATRQQARWPVPATARSATTPGRRAAGGQSTSVAPCTPPDRALSACRNGQVVVIHPQVNRRVRDSPSLKCSARVWRS